MNSKITTIKNPLTVIAIFAGTAEISGTAVLPFLGLGNQQIYLWFLMSFPFTLIALFFITLNWNHKVLYAPSDFKDEDNFINILKKQSRGETLQRIEQEIMQDIKSGEDETIAVIDVQEEKMKYEMVISTKDERTERDKTARNITRHQMHEYRIAEKLVLQKLEKELGVSIESDMKMEIGNSIYMLDGFISKGNSFTVIEIKYMRKKNALNSNQWNAVRGVFESMYESIPEVQRNEFTLIFAVATDENLEELREYIQNKLINFKFQIIVKVYDFDELVNEMGHQKQNT